jgi:hypothetical protein
MKLMTANVAAAVLIFAAQASAQWATHHDSSIPRTGDGAPNLSAPQKLRTGNRIYLESGWPTLIRRELREASKTWFYRGIS